MLFYDHEKVRDSLETLHKCKKDFDGYFIGILDSVSRIESFQAEAGEDTSVSFADCKENAESFITALQQMISTIEYAQNCYSKTGKKLVVECEKLFINSASEKMQKISLEAYRREMKDIYFEKRYANE